jgi:hypothetical protein
VNTVFVFYVLPLIVPHITWFTYLELFVITSFAIWIFVGVMFMALQIGSLLQLLLASLIAIGMILIFGAVGVAFTVPLALLSFAIIGALSRIPFWFVDMPVIKL